MNTPLPWSLHVYQDGKPLVYDAEGERRVSVTLALGSGDTLIGQFHSLTPTTGYPSPTEEEMRANVALVLRAVNCHSELVSALERFVSLCPSSEGLGGHAPIGAFCIAADAARMALAKAKGEA